MVSRTPVVKEAVEVTKQLNVRFVATPSVQEIVPDGYKPVAVELANVSSYMLNVKLVVCGTIVTAPLT